MPTVSCGQPHPEGQEQHGNTMFLLRTSAQQIILALQCNLLHVKLISNMHLLTKQHSLHQKSITVETTARCLYLQKTGTFCLVMTEYFSIFMKCSCFQKFRNPVNISRTIHETSCLFFFFCFNEQNMFLQLIQYQKTSYFPSLSVAIVLFFPQTSSFQSGISGFNTNITRITCNFDYVLYFIRHFYTRGNCSYS